MTDILHIETLTYCELDMVHGGQALGAALATQTTTTIRAPLSGAVNQNIKAPLSGNVTVNAPKGPMTMSWGANTLFGNFSWNFSWGR